MVHQIGYWVLVVLGFGFLIFIHELGHFLAAKSVGIRVIRFALGFGPRLFGKKIGATDYCICLIPAGGYVKMAGGEGEQEATGAPDEFPSKTPGQRALVVLAGPVMSILVTIPLLFGIFAAGMERPSSRIDGIVVEGGAWAAGLKRGDLITGVRSEGSESWTGVQTWRDVTLNAALKYNVGDVEVRFERDGEERIIKLETNEDGQLGVRPAIIADQAGYATTTVAYVPPNKPAANAGIKPGERILEINGRTIHTWYDEEDVVRASANQDILIRCETTDGRTETRSVHVGAKPYFGMGIRASRPTTIRLVRPDFPAEKAGLLPGDIVQAVNDLAVNNWPQLKGAVVDAAPGPVTLQVRRGDELVEVTVNLERGSTIGDTLGIAAAEYPVVEGFVAGSGAEAAGIPVGATLLSLKPGDADSDDKPLNLSGGDGLEFMVRPGDDAKRVTLTYQLEREEISPAEDAKSQEKTEAPKKPTEQTATFDLAKGELGVLDITPLVERVPAVPPGDVPAALGRALKETGKWAHAAVRGIWLLVTGQLPFSMMSGPVMIFTVSRYQAQAGFLRFFEFLAIITVHLGVINLVPFPILDGGHVLFLAIEKVRRKPVPEKVMATAMYAGMFLLLLLMVLVTGNDIAKLLHWFGG